MEYLPDWIQIERNENDIAGLLRDAAISLPYTLQKDATGLTLHGYNYQFKAVNRLNARIGNENKAGRKGFRLPTAFTVLK